MKKYFSITLAAAAMIMTLCGCSKDTCYPESLATDQDHLWVCVDSGSQTSATLDINNYNYCVLTLSEIDGVDPDITYSFDIIYDSSTGNASVNNIATVGGVSGNIIAAEGKEKTAISVKFSQIVSGGEAVIFQGVMTYESVAH